MTYANILKQANLHRGQIIDTLLGNWYINEGMKLLATEYDTACKRDSAALTCLADEWTTLPTGLIRITRCRVTDTITEFNEYEAYPTELRATRDVDLTIDYIRPHDDITGSVGTPGIHELYHKPLALFMAARDRQRIMADEDGDSIRLMSEFLSEAVKANARLTSTKGTRKTMKVARFI